MSPNTSPIQPVPVTLDKPRSLRYDAFALMMAERKLGKPIARLDYESLETTLTILWAGLVHEDPRLTVEEVARFVNPGEFGEISQKITEAMEAAGWNRNRQDGDAPLAETPGGSLSPPTG